jgi:ubiquinone/menaquinone biosynthesis C-methylase UbiE/uncharacterized protein YbaR (Trm112 family)
MDQHTSAAKHWLDRRYSRGADGRYKAHQPIQGLRTEFSEPNALVRLARTYKLLEWIHGLKFESVLDIGGGEGYLSALIRDLFDPQVVHTCDLSVEANRRAWELFGIGGVSADASRLPFADGAYDLVVCSEVIEHLSRPALAIGEVMRVARKYAIVSTAEFSPLGETERKLRVLTLDRSYPHAELNWFTPDDFTLLMGDNTVMSPQYKSIAHRLPVADRGQDDVERTLVFLTDARQIGVDRTGVIAVHAKDGTVLEPQPFTATDVRRTLDRLLEGPLMQSPVLSPGGVDPELGRRLRCVSCGARVEPRGSDPSLACEGCGTGYQLSHGVPVMLTDDQGDSHQAAREAECASRLAGGRAERRERIVGLMAHLHNSSAGRHGAAVHWVAEQSLRILWLVGRHEPWASRLKRVGRRLFGLMDAGDAAMLATLAAPPTDPAPKDGVARQHRP